MSEILLQTKLFVPPVRPLLVPRPRLIEKLNAGLAGKLILVSAPAGFGKTTLVADWLSQLTINNSQFTIHNYRVAWLSLDEHDNLLSRFFTYLVVAMQTIDPNLAQGLYASLHSPQPPADEAILPALLNELAAYQAPLVLVLDDYHVITQTAVHEAVAQLIDHLPPDIHLILTSREDPSLPLPRWRARGQLTEIGAPDLRFTADEAMAFLRQTMGLQLDEAAMNTLEARTEGWVAGLQLAALSLRHAADASAFIDDFTGSDRQVADYLLQEVLYRQPETVQRFLLRTSILERFNASLCNHLLAQENSQDILDSLEQANLFIVPLDNRRYWYRYHHLFAQLLQYRLHRDTPETAVQEDHRRAAGWYEGEGLLDEAIFHALQIEDVDYAAQLVASISTHTLWEQGGSGLMKQWAQALPEDVIQQHPRVAILAAGAHIVAGGDLQQVQAYLSLVKNEETVQGEHDLIQATLVRTDGDYLQALQLVQQALPKLPAADKALLAIARLQLVTIYYALGKLDEAEQEVRQLRRDLSADDHANLSMLMQAIRMQALSAATRADYYSAEQHCQEGLALLEEVGQTNLPMIGLLYNGLGEVYYQWDEMEKASAFYERAGDWGQRTGITDILLDALLGQANLACWRHDQAGFHAIIQEFQTFARRTQLRDFVRQMETIVAALSLQIGDLETAVHWANASGFKVTDPDPEMDSSYLTLAKIRLAESRSLGGHRMLPHILALLDKLIHQATAVGHKANLIAYYILKALTFDLQGETKPALSALQAAIELAEPGSLVRVFLDAGPPMQALLAKADHVHPLYVRRLLHAFAQEQTADSRSSTTSPPIHLTNREQEILQHIAAGLSNKAIEEKLVISKNTVRTHIKNLYSKLGVENRVQAINRAQELNLL